MSSWPVRAWKPDNKYLNTSIELDLLDLVAVLVLEVMEFVLQLLWRDNFTLWKHGKGWRQSYKGCDEDKADVHGGLGQLGLALEKSALWSLTKINGGMAMTGVALMTRLAAVSPTA